MIQKSEIDFSDLDWCEVAKYIRVVCDEAELEEAGVVQHLPVRTSTSGPKPTVRYLQTDTTKTRWTRKKRKMTLRLDIQSDEDELDDDRV